MRQGSSERSPDRIESPETGETLTRGFRPFRVEYAGLEQVVELPGYYPSGEGDGVHVGDDMAVVDEALRQLKRKAASRATAAQ